MPKGVYKRKKRRAAREISWPANKAITLAQRHAFRAALTELMRAVGMDHTDLARKMYGTDERGQARHHGTIRKYVSGESFPKLLQAVELANALNVELPRLLAPESPYEPMHVPHDGDPLEKLAADGREVVPVNGGNEASRGPANRKGNGHTRHEVEVLPLPEGAKPASISLVTLPGDARFAEVNVSGVMQIEHALTLVAMLAGRGH